MDDVSAQSATRSGGAAASADRQAPPNFTLGIAMAGAISAGSYSAGALDFLIEALTEWEGRRQEPETPPHQVTIAALSGASAGGLTGALSLMSLAGGVAPGPAPLPATPLEPAPPREPAPPAEAPEDGAEVRRHLPELYDAWVRSPGLTPPTAEDGPALLKADDLAAPSAPVVSLLDCTVLDAIAEQTVTNAARRAAAAAGRTKFGFLSDPLHLFLTITNVDGVPYRMRFVGDGAKMHVMRSHADRAHFAVSGLGGQPFPLQGESSWLESWNDPGRPVDFSPGGAFFQSPAERDRYIQSALATSAFPIGLRPARLSRNTEDYAGQAWGMRRPCGRDDEFVDIAPAWPPHDITVIGVDGGAMNNHPFDLARWAIRDLAVKEGEQARPDARTVDRAVIMIDPFPSSAPINPARLTADRALSIGGLARALMPALLNQARFKASDLAAAEQESQFSRFLISPSRFERIQSADAVEDRPADPPLASAVLGAFGGFIDERFRRHDFQLGRRNAQRFLKRYFVLHKDNPLFRDWTEAMKATYAVPDPSDPNAPERDFLPVIPCLGSAAQEAKPLIWPSVEMEQVLSVEAATRERSRAVAQRMIRRLKSWSRRGAMLGWWYGRHYLDEMISCSLRSELCRSGQLDLRSVEPSGFSFFRRRSDPATLDARLADPMKRHALMSAMAALESYGRRGWSAAQVHAANEEVAATAPHTPRPRIDEYEEALRFLAKQGLVARRRRLSREAASYTRTTRIRSRFARIRDVKLAGAVVLISLFGFGVISLTIQLWRSGLLIGSS